jgi:FkbM family methyltransferase
MMAQYMRKVAMQGVKATRTVFVAFFKPLGKSRRAFFNALLYGVIRSVWNHLPDMSNFTFTASLGGSQVRFRPFVMHDFLFVLANANQNHEPLVQAVFKPKPGEVMVDVGAHIGLYTMRAAKAVGSYGRVISAEPDPQSYALLKENIRLNGLANVHAENAALSDCSGQMTFYACTDPSLSGFELQPKAKLREKRVVKTLTLDELLDMLGVEQVNWIKLDVEGAETKVLRGAEKLLRRAKNLHIIVESDSTQAMDYLAGFGFKTRYLGEIYYYAEKVVV